MGIGSLTWRQVDQRILDGLREYGPTPALEIGYRLKIDYLTSLEEQRRSLDRLVADGLVERYTEVVKDEDAPLFESRIVIFYAAKGVGS